MIILVPVLGGLAGVSLFKSSITVESYCIGVLSILLICGLLFTPHITLAETIAVVKSVDIKPYKRAIKGFKEVHSADVTEYVLRYKGANGGDREKLLLLVDGENADLVFTLGTEALALLKQQFSDIPVIFSFVLNPNKIIGGDWDESLPNLWGISMTIPSVAQFKILQQAVPKARRIGVIYDPSRTGDLVTQAALDAKRLGMQLVPQAISSPEDSIAAIDSLQGKVDALWMVPDTTVITRESMKYMLLFSFRNGLPLIGISEKYVKSGALFALSFDSEDIGRQAGEMAEMILDGKGESEAGLQDPRRLRLSINIKTAKKIGLTVPDRLVEMADTIY